jgi:hypothetical protein
MDASGVQPAINSSSVIWWVLIGVFSIICQWRVFVKAGKPGWAAIIPIYNTIVLLQIAKKPVWWILLLLLPIVNIIIGIMAILSFGKSFGKSGVFSFFLLLLLSPIGYAILAFDNSKYR